MGTSASLLQPEEPPNLSVAINRWPQTDDELWWFVKAIWGVGIPRRRVCPGHKAPFEAFADAYFARYPVTVWKASRGFGGKTKTLAILGLMEALAYQTYVVILGGSSAQSLRVHEEMQGSWEGRFAPRHILRHETRFDTYLHNGGHIRALMASTKSVRGPHPTRLRLDEIDEMELLILDAAMGQPMEQEGIDSQTVMSSTHQYPDKTMTAMLNRAKENGWPIYEWCIAAGSFVMTERGEVPIESVRTDDRVLTRQGWKPVQHVTLMGKKQTITLVLNDGRRLTCTPDHLLHTSAGWVPADSALSVTTIGADVPVRVTTSLTNIQTSAIGPCPTCVLASRYAFQMGEPDAGPTPAQVVDVMTSRYGAVNLLPDELMDLDRRPSFFSLDSPDTVAVSLGANPLHTVGFHAHHNTVVRVETSNEQPVYDIGVHEAHEFVANGVLVHNCYRETSVPKQYGGWLTDRAIARKRTEVSKVMWDTEYDLQEPSFEGRAIMTEAVENYFDPNLGTFPGGEGEYIEIEEPVEHGEYVTGVDWAKHQDWTIIATYRIDPGASNPIGGTSENGASSNGSMPAFPWKLVAFERLGRRPWPAMVHRLDERLYRYAGHCAHDATGLGTVVADLIHAKVNDVTFTGRNKADLLSEYVSAIENNSFKAPRIEFMYNEHKYATNDDLYGTGHPPDTLVAGALAWHLRANKLPLAIPDVETWQRAMSPWTIY